MQVGSTAWHSGLRICHCSSYGLVHGYDLELIPSMAAPCAMGLANNNNNNKFKNREFPSWLGGNEPD